MQTYNQMKKMEIINEEYQREKKHQTKSKETRHSNITSQGMEKRVG